MNNYESEKEAAESGLGLDAETLRSQQVCNSGNFEEPSSLDGGILEYNTAIEIRFLKMYFDVWGLAKHCKTKLTKTDVSDMLHSNIDLFPVFVVFIYSWTDYPLTSLIS